MKALQVADQNLSWQEPQPITTSNHSVAIIVHVFYVEIWEELRTYLDRLTMRFDLFVTLTAQTSQSDILDIIAHTPNIHIYQVENRGRDVLPFLQVVSLFGENTYQTICKLHTKRTGGSDLGEVWRKLLYFDLIGSNATVEKIIDTLANRPEIGVVAGKNTLLDAQTYDFDNAAKVKEIAKKADLEYRPSYLFPAGTMFWIKFDLLVPLIILFKRGELHFEKEMGQKDNTLAHAIERIFGLLCQHRHQELIESPSKYSQLDDALLDKMSSLVLSQQYIDFETYTHALKTIKEKDQYIKELEALAQSLRIKNRIKRVLPMDAIQQAKTMVSMFNNPAMLKKVIHHVKHGNFSYILTKTKEKLRKNIHSATAMEKINPSRYFQAFNLSDYAIKNLVVDIIIPVYNGYEFLEPLFDSLEKNTTSPHRLIIINDCSPDERVKPFLLERLERHSESIFIDHETNQGFLKSVNEAVSHTHNHFVILNTDTEVPKYWLERLMYPIVNMDNIASTTPFTNSGEIASFPNFIADNTIFEEMDVDALDRVFREINPNDFYTEMPTGVGFCMGVNHALVKKIGFFDEEKFGKGYGEENDWCQRAIKNGYKNILVPNLFVYHKHGGSFSAQEKQQLLNKNLIKLSEIHPNYAKDVHGYIQKDPHKVLRHILILVASSKDQEGVTLVIDHLLGGGANIYANELINQYKNKGKKVLNLLYDYYTGSFKLYFDYNHYHFAFSLSDLNALELLLRQIRFQEIFVNNLVSFKASYAFLDLLKNLAQKDDTTLIIPLHDYYPICPSYTLLDENGEFCEVPSSLEKCQNCMRLNNLEWKTYFADKADMVRWRKSWGELLDISSKILCFSHASKALLLRAYPALDQQRIEVMPHHVDFLPAFTKVPHPNKKETVIGVLGALNLAKGAGILKHLVKAIEQNDLAIKVVLIGEISDAIKSNHFEITGRYKRDQLPKLVEKYQIDIFLIPSIWPETFSYTTQEIMMMEMPLMVFDLGAPAERVKTYPKGVVLQKEYVENILKYVQNFRE